MDESITCFIIRDTPIRVIFASGILPYLGWLSAKYFVSLWQLF